MKDLKDLKREEIFSTELIGDGLPDLETEIAKLNQGSQEVDQGFGGFGGLGDSDIFGQTERSEADEEEEQ